MLGMSVAEGRPVNVPKVFTLLADKDSFLENVGVIAKPHDPSRAVDYYEQAWWQSGSPVALTAGEVRNLWERNKDGYVEQVNVAGDWLVGVFGLIINADRPFGGTKSTPGR